METKEKIMEEAKSLIFKYMPEAIQVFDTEDPPYFIYSEFTDYLIENIHEESIVKRAADIINKALSIKHNYMEEMVVIQVFQRFFYQSSIEQELKIFLSEESLTIFEKYKKLYEYE